MNRRTQGDFENQIHRLRDKDCNRGSETNSEKQKTDTRTEKKEEKKVNKKYRLTLRVDPYGDGHTD